MHYDRRRLVDLRKTEKEEEDGLSEGRTRRTPGKRVVSKARDCTRYILVVETVIFALLKTTSGVSQIEEE